MLALRFKHIVRGSQELDISNDETRFLEDFASGRGGEGFAMFEVAAGTLEGTW
jgi:hypothetical protein